MTSCQAQLVEHLVKPNMTGPELFRLLPIATYMRVNTLHKISHGFVQVILNTITTPNLTVEASAAIISSCKKILLQLCQQHCGLQITLR